MAGTEKSVTEMHTHFIVKLQLADILILTLLAFCVCYILSNVHAEMSLCLYNLLCLINQICTADPTYTDHQTTC